MSVRGTVIALAAVSILLGVSARAAAQSCNTNAVPLQCNGTFDPLDTIGVALLKITAKDLSPTNAGGQNVSAQVCDVGTLDDTFGLEVLRTSSPKEVLRCLAIAGSGTGCSLTPVAKPATATSDTLYVVLQGPGPDIANFEVRATGWETLRVDVVDTSRATVVLPTGVGCP